MPPTGDLTCKPDTSPDWESNQWPFDSQAGTQSTKPHQPGLVIFLIDFEYFCINTSNKFDVIIC